MTDTTPRLALSELTAAQAQKHVTVNENLIALDALINTQVTSMALITPPDDPDDGDCYIVADSATDDWADYDGKIAYCIDGDWSFYTPFTGQMIYNAADGLYYRYDGSDWTADLAVLSADQSWSGAQAFTGGVSIGGYSVSLGGAFTSGGAVTFSGAYAATIAVPGAYTWTLPAQSGTLAELELAQEWTKHQTILSSGAYGLTVRKSGSAAVSLRGNYPSVYFNAYYDSDANAYLYGTSHYAWILQQSIGSDVMVLIRYASGTSGNSLSDATTIIGMSAAKFYPGVDDAMSNGTSSYRWTQLYAATTTISTSDSTKKTNVRGLSDAECAAAQEMWENICILQFIDAVKNKGTDSARLHAGSIADAQIRFDAVLSVQAIFEKHGLDPEHYAFWCKDKKAGETAGADAYEYSLRYTELIMFILSGIARAHKDLKARVTALEAAISA